MSRLSQWWRDWCRGYTDAEFRSAQHKLVVVKGLMPGGITYMTNGEMKAANDMLRWSAQP